MARVLCINPWIYDFAAYNMWMEPLGLLAVASVLRGAGHDVGLVDCLDRHHPDAPAPRATRDAYGCGRYTKVEVRKPPALAHVPRHWGRYGLPLWAFDAELGMQPRPDAVLVTSMMTYWYPGPFEVIRRVKSRWPGMPVALGGVYATLCADHARAYSGADAVLTGPGEESALEWVSDLTGKDRAGETRTSIDVLPAHDLRRPQGYVAIQTARGCPYRCPYCAVHRLAPAGYTPRPAKEVIREIAWCVEDLGARDVVFYDDALLVDPGHHAMPILEGVIARGLHVRFHTPNGLHARYVDAPVARAMRRARFVTIRLGLETADPEVQCRDGGKVDRECFAQAVEALYSVGFTGREVAAYVLVGRPGQRIDAARETVAYAHRLGVQVRLAQFSPIPGTVEWDTAVAAGDLAADADPLLHNNSIYPCAGAEAWETFKQQVSEGNRQVRQG